MKFFSLIAGILLFTPFAEAADEARWYTVEVIAFAHTSNAGVQEERWPEDPGIPDTGNSISLVSGIHEEILPGQPIEFQALRLEVLAGSLAALRRSSRYRVLDAKAWRFQGLPLASALAVRIKAGQRYLAGGEVAPPSSSTPERGTLTLGREPDNLAANTGSTEDNALYELDGRIRISLTRFLDVDADLIYRTQVILPDTLGNQVNRFRRFRLTEFRRMKSNTIHYLDHPMFGLVIAINRYQLPELPDVTATEEISPAKPLESKKNPAPITAQ